MTSFRIKTIVCYVAVVEWWLVSSLTSEAGRPSPCQIWKSDIQKSEEDVKVSRNYKGLWLSEKCEIHPGPRFLLRRYHFLRNGKFHLTRYYYSDPWCSSAAFSVTAVGSFHPSPEKATASSSSWVVPGGLELDFTLRKMTLVPFTVRDAKTLSERVNSSCPGLVGAEWKPYKKYKVLNYEDHNVRNKAHYLKLNTMMNDVDCTSSLGISFNELQLIRMEHRTPLHFLHHRSSNSQEGMSRRYRPFLYLGADGRNPRIRPTYYQVPLLPSQAQSCPVCHILSKASAVVPPELSPIRSHHLLPPVDLDSHWISLRCEVRPYGLFLRREFFFNSKTKQWTGQHDYFKDPQCRNPMFTLAAEGLFSIGKPSKDIPDATECDFQILDSTITPKDHQFASNLNGLPTCGTKSSWKVGQVGNLSVSGGCKELGISVPSTEMELIRFDVEKPGSTFLYLGDGSEEHKRPTSFQLPLVQCSSFEMVDADDQNLLINDLRPLPLISGSPLCFYHLQGGVFLLAFLSFLLCIL